ncbi:MAG: 6-phosphofructokinase [Bdellovibrionales bacterium]|nr:6-phosphofructokinase [Bdellovibrionales bacterium]
MNLEKNLPLKKIAVLTSGGDSPGMNAAIRSVVRSGVTQGLEVLGINHGYLGLLKKMSTPLQLRSVSNILQRGGTILKAGRCLDFLQEDHRKAAAQFLKTAGVEGLIVIGGDGSYRGALALGKEHQIPVVGVPGTIDNDIHGTEMTIGFDTAVNTALEAIDRIRDTAASLDRLFIVEVMGRESGHIAVEVGLAGGAEAILIPENPIPVEEIVQQIQRGIQRGKTSSILVAAEGQKPGRTYDLAEQIRKKSGFEAKVCILGHIQRGGSPTATDRNLASRMGAAAVQVLLQGKANLMISQQSHQIVMSSLEVASKGKRAVDKDLIKLAQVLAN